MTNKYIKKEIEEILSGKNRELKCPYCPYELMGGSIAPHTMKVHPDKFISKIDRIMALILKLQSETRERTLEEVGMEHAFDDYAGISGNCNICGRAKGYHPNQELKK